MPALVAGMFITMLTTLATFFDDPLPPPGEAYRGLPVPFLKGKPLQGSDRRWSVRWRFATFDILFWGGLAYWVGSTGILRPRAPRPGHCRNCGYDLTGNLSGICPECGAAV